MLENKPTQNLLIPKHLPWLMWSLGALFFCYEFMLQVSPSVMVNQLMKTFNVNAAQLGNLSAFYLYAYTFMQIPVGLLLDRFGVRRLMTLAALVCALGALLFASAPTFLVASLGRFLIGFGSAFAVVSGLHIAATWLPINRFALMTGVFLTIGFIGAICGQAPLAIMVNHIGWRHTLLTFAMIGGCLSILLWLIVRDRPMGFTAGSSNTNAKASLRDGLKHVLRSKQSWLIAIYAGLMYLPTPAFAALWGVPFLMQSHKLSSASAALIVSMIYVGYAVGCPLFGWLSDRLGRRRPPLFIASVGSLLSLLIVLYCNQFPLALTACCLFAFGFFTSGCFTAFSIAREINPPQVNATTLGFVNTLNSLGGGLAQPLIGFILDLRWGGQMQNGVRHFSTNDFHVALAILPVCLFISIILLPFIKETFCKPLYNH